MKNTNIFVTKCLLGLGCLASTGCFTILDPGASQATQEREDVLILREENRRLAGRVESLELQMDRLHEDLDQVRASQRGVLADVDQRVDGRLDRVEQQIAAVDAARQKDREEIIDKLSSKISQVMASSSSSPSRRYSSSGSGYEHVVDTGQTLSEIARAYGVTMNAIIQENNLQNPNQLRVGQTLFIPE